MIRAFASQEPFVMSPTAAPYQLFVGVDIAATVRLLPGPERTPLPTAPSPLSSPRRGYQRLLDRVAATGLAPDQVLVVLEATSTY